MLLNQKNEQLKEDHFWQRRLLPMMVGSILALTLFFFAATMYQLFELNQKIQAAPEINHNELLGMGSKQASFVANQWRSLVVLESHVLQQRYHQANVLLMGRIWIRYLGFVTGMILAIIGAVFILGKLREPTTTLDLSAGEGMDSGTPRDSGTPGSAQHSLKLQLVTQSPGIVLAVLGTVLMLITILIHHPIEVKDKPMYTVVDAIGVTDFTNANPPSSSPLTPKPLKLDPQTDSSLDPDADFQRLLNDAKIRHGVKPGGQAP